MVGPSVSVGIHNIQKPFFFVLVLMLCGLSRLIFIIRPRAIIIISICLDLRNGVLFSLSLIVTLNHAHTVHEAGQLVFIVQNGGHLIASTIPLIAGII